MLKSAWRWTDCYTIIIHIQTNISYMSHVTQDHYRSQNAGRGRSVIKPEDAITTEGWINGDMYFGNCTYNKVDDNIAVDTSPLYIDVQSLTNKSKQSIQVQLEVIFTSAVGNTLHWCQAILKIARLDLAILTIGNLAMHCLTKR